MGILDDIVAGNKETFKQHQIYKALILTRKLKKKLVSMGAIDIDAKQESPLVKSVIRNFDTSIASVAKEWAATVDDTVWKKAVSDVAKLLFGDPQTMLKERHLRLQALPYWNPTKYKINIHALGVVKTVKITDITVTSQRNSGKAPYLNQRQETVDFEEFVEPGAIVYIPYTYTTGGKHSSLYGVAPQLQPLPVMHEDDFGADLSPTTYTEWCTFMSPEFISNCCKRPGGWNIDTNKLVCSKCGK
jgi:hypothetical protein